MISIVPMDTLLQTLKDIYTKLLTLPGPGMFPLISAIFCSYFPINGPEHGKPNMVQANSDINYRYISQIDRYRWNNAILCTYFLAGVSRPEKKAAPVSNLTQLDPTN
ncbi:hypothetical protein ABEO75_04275 [Paenibacillus macerans]|uniref:hypothetical protein n=1 Tax=Paenibacillus macerans TaxID=44252 RepID=UPI002E1C9F01|nr:hypothetical protein [Paenibacillus macerans]